MHGVFALCVVPAEAVKRDQDDIVLLLRFGRVGAVIDVDEREGRIEGWGLSRQLLGKKKREDQEDGGLNEAAQSTRWHQRYLQTESSDQAYRMAS